MGWKKQLAENIKLLMDDPLRPNAKKFARKCDVSDRAISSYIKGDGNPTLELLFKIAKANNVPISQIIPETHSENFISPFTEITFIPKYKARLSGGHGSFETSDQIEANLAFRTDFVRQKGNPNDMALFEVMGDSMIPFLHEGDVVLVDLAKKNIEDIVDGKAFAFREDHTVKVKRLSRQGNKLLATSENTTMYPPYEVEKENFQLIGRVVWVGHEVD